MSRSLVLSGANLAIVDIHNEEAAERAKEIREEFRQLHSGQPVPNITAHYADVGKKSEVDQSIREVLEEHGEITNLVTCAGYCQNVKAVDMTSEQIKAMLSVNLEGTFYSATAVAKYLIANKKPGNMVFIGSISGSIVNVPQPQAMYNSSKAAVRHLAASLAVEWASKDIRVNTLSPGYMITEIAMKAPILAENPGLKAEWESKIPQGRMGPPEELMGTVAFLASDASNYITGQEIKKFEYFAASPSNSLIEGSAGFLLYDSHFLDILRSKPTLRIIAEDTTGTFAHEAGVYIPATDDIFITSNHMVKNGKKYVQISRVFRTSETTGNTDDTKEPDYHVEIVEPGPDILLANGGVNYKDGVLFCEQVSLTEPGGLTYMTTHIDTMTGQYRSTKLLSNYHGRWFNSVNDVVVHRDGGIWFTDPPYGHEQGIRPVPQLPAQTYRFDPFTGNVRAVEDSLQKPNGLCFSPDQKILYITDTAGVRGDTTCPGVYSPARPASIYAFDVIVSNGGQFLTNKRLFAFADRGIPDGIKCDLAGNVYSGCGDGVHVWAPDGTLLGKIVVPEGCANFCFGRKSELYLLNERRMWMAQLSPTVQGDLLGL
ncbi:uncharacterized protein N0V89_001908 [Didymosphaeria variabile]|uniref:SMP-30/Gluconolactonase/LRE-like region domain-containing protein n=1 Tax=Didymosphaeria variabile TaxID=1932322 RepID=A0A9W8XT51_9PLEO|nr:uncharacterized protein N0V89_001908 [Didymosphaeria variabile]KAJ4357333.1 hypothetical protein N0V89_001908 [Didymosphaeria variabile]